MHLLTSGLFYFPQLICGFCNELNNYETVGKQKTMLLNATGICALPATYNCPCMIALKCILRVSIKLNLVAKP